MHERTPEGIAKCIGRDLHRVDLATLEQGGGGACCGGIERTAQHLVSEVTIPGKCISQWRLECRAHARPRRRGKITLPIEARLQAGHDANPLRQGAGDRGLTGRVQCLTQTAALGRDLADALAGRLLRGIQLHGFTDMSPNGDQGHLLPVEALLGS